MNRTQAPPFNQVSSISFLEPVKTNLDNGVPIYSISGGSEDVLKIDFIFKAGKWFQESPLVAAATNKLMQEGTKKYSSLQIAEGIDQYGAFLETAFSYDNATITVYTLSKHLVKVLPYIKEIMAHPVFFEHEFETYKNNSLEKFKINLEKVAFLAQAEFMQLVSGKTNPYGIKTEQTDFEKLTLDDVKKFHAKHYNIKSCTIIVSGKVDENIVDIINQHIGNISDKSSITPINKNLINQDENALNSVYIKKEDALQSAIRIGRLFPNKTHSDYYGLQILNSILGGYFGSRLMKNIREDKGYTYGIGSGIMDLQHNTIFFISTEVGVDVTKEAISEIYKEIEILRTEKINQEELDLVKNYLLGQLLRSCDGSFNMAALFENTHFYGLDFSFYNNYIKKIKSITADELLSLAQFYLKKEDLKEVIVGSYTK